MDFILYLYFAIYNNYVSYSYFVFTRSSNPSFPLLIPHLHYLVIPHLQNDYALDKCTLFSVYLYHAIFKEYVSYSYFVAYKPCPGKFHGCSINS